MVMVAATSVTCIICEQSIQEDESVEYGEQGIDLYCCFMDIFQQQTVMVIANDTYQYSSTALLVWHAE
jgi:transcription elongation factor Elf1